MLGEFWKANDAMHLKTILGNLESQHQDRGEWPLQIQVKKYADPRSLEQNDLLHVWCKEFTQHVLDKHKVTEVEKEAMRITLQRHCYVETRWGWLIEEVTDLFTGKVSTQRRSTTKFLKGEMTMFLDWIAKEAANRGLILEARGEYLELQNAA